MGIFLPSSNIDDFVQVARLIGGDSMPPWLPEHLRKWTGSLFLIDGLRKSNPLVRKCDRSCSMFKTQRSF